MRDTAAFIELSSVLLMTTINFISALGVCASIAVKNSITMLLMWFIKLTGVDVIAVLVVTIDAVVYTGIVRMAAAVVMVPMVDSRRVFNKNFSL